MKITPLILVFILFASCNFSGGNNTASDAETENLASEDGDSSDNTVETLTDEDQIKKALKDVLKWSDSNEPFFGFVPVYNSDKKAVGMDMDELEFTQLELLSTELFDAEFIDHYANIVKTIDRYIKADAINWNEGEHIPFAGANPYCFCQDIPYKDPKDWWEKIDIIVDNIDNDKAQGEWYWEYGESDSQRFEAKKSDGKWKISFLEGFDNILTN